MKNPAYPNNLEAQRARVLERLRQGSLSTLKARADLDVLHPAARMIELRKQGHEIVTMWMHEHSSCGRLHRVGRYTLLPSNGGQRLPLRFRQAVGSSRRAAR